MDTEEKLTWKDTYCKGSFHFQCVTVWMILEINLSFVLNELTKIRHNSDGYFEVINFSDIFLSKKLMQSMPAW
jgi:hypothetical protein